MPIILGKITDSQLNALLTFYVAKEHVLVGGGRSGSEARATRRMIEGEFINRGFSGEFVNDLVERHIEGTRLVLEEEASGQGLERRG